MLFGLPLDGTPIGPVVVVPSDWDKQLLHFVNDYVLYLSFLNLEGSGVYNLLFAYDKTCVRFCTMSILH
ncbi:hypothetical protein BDA96_06G207300 [Sorghum bicolor]|uniref:Uncharacterized protein n=1 Tax=Sorghum bicolor TaxID=4558 RepID=A0A921UD50_SORBI|nr:hypothetical protein BDA96_06G207300 [Sorghum bicolor]